MIHPNVRYIPNNEMERLFPKRHSKQFIHCFDGFFSNEKVMILNYSDIEAQMLDATLQHLSTASRAFFKVTDINALNGCMKLSQIDFLIFFPVSVCFRQFLERFHGTCFLWAFGF